MYLRSILIVSACISFLSKELVNNCTFVKNAPMNTLLYFFILKINRYFFIARVAKISLALFEVILYTFFRVWLTNYPSDKNDPTLLAISVLV